MKILAALLSASLLATGCASSGSSPAKRSPSIFPPAPTPRPARPPATVTVQAVTPRPPLELRFIYPPGAWATNWTLQISTDLTTWRDVAANVGTDGWVNITNSLPRAFYRMKGTR